MEETEKAGLAGSAGVVRPPISLPRLYAILDIDMLAQAGLSLENAAAEMYESGIRLFQYRAKSAAPQTILQASRSLRSVCPEAAIVLNDRPDLAILADANGVHVGQQDLPPVAARRIIGPARILGISTHNDAQVRAAALTSADYIAIGPVFTTSSKQNPDPIIGLEGIRRARSLTSKPLVAIGGITRADARSVIEAGADSIAVISGLFAPGETVAQVVRDFLEILR